MLVPINFSKTIDIHVEDQQIKVDNIDELETSDFSEVFGGCFFIDPGPDELPDPDPPFPPEETGESQE